MKLPHLRNHSAATNVLPAASASGERAQSVGRTDLRPERISGFIVALGATLTFGFLAAGCAPPKDDDASPNGTEQDVSTPPSEPGASPTEPGATPADPDGVPADRDGAATDPDGAPTNPDDLPTAAPSSPACTHYIAPNGSDGASGTLSAPWRTINFASRKLKPGNVLCARGGTYYGQGGYVWHSSGTATAPITFKNYPGETPVFDGQWNKTGVGGSWIVFSGNQWIVVDGFTAQQYNDQYGNGTIVLLKTSGVTIQNCTIRDSGTTNQDHNIYISESTSKIVVRNNFLVRAAGAGVHFWHGPNCDGCEVYNNVFIGGTTASGSKTYWGVVAGDVAQNVTIYNNTFYGVRTAIDLGYTGENLKGIKNFTIKNNVITNSDIGLRVASFNASQVQSDHNLWFGNSKDVVWNADSKASSWSLAQYQANTSNEDHSISANPLFVNPAADNFRLSAGSPATDKGIALSLVTYDKDRVGRPRGAGYDLGAYESH